MVGGISKTLNYKGNRIDIGGHRFFSKSKWVMEWWRSLLPIASPKEEHTINIKYQNDCADLNIKKYSEDLDDVMLVRNRVSRIIYNRKFFSYPLKINLDTLWKIGILKSFIFGLSYCKAILRPIKPEVSLQDFLINRFGYRLYLQFFKTYSEKVWGRPCSEISAEWGAQRIKSLSISKALFHALKGLFGLSKKGAKQTSLVENFIYPKFGPGQMWEKAAAIFCREGGSFLLNCKVNNIEIIGDKVVAVSYINNEGNLQRVECTHLISTMSIKELVAASCKFWPKSVVDLAAGLKYRDFITVGLLYQEFDMTQVLKDNWIYVQESDVKVGRIQIFNNWSPYMVAGPGLIWLGLEYFCNEGDDLWSLSDDNLKILAQREINNLGLAKSDKSKDAVVIRVKKAYPSYFGESYDNFDQLKFHFDKVENLFLIGRNGMHRYNNQDHSMLTAKKATEAILNGSTDKSPIWNVNIDDDYHEEIKDQK